MKVKKVLVIDDNQDITDAISFNLSSIGIECKITNRGRQGLDIIKNNADNADIVLLDLAIPEFSGLDVFASLHNEGLLEKRNVVVFTASNLAETEIQQMLSGGARAILKKPLSLDELDLMLKQFN
jgi:DNA-binding response OmpR family regulator